MTSLVAVPLLEIVLLVHAGKAIGVWWTLALLIAIGLAGSWLIGRQGNQARRDLKAAIRDGRMPTDAAADSILVFTAGVLLILPGLLTDIAAIGLLLPPTRALGRKLMRASVEKRLPGGADLRLPGQHYRPHGDVIEGVVVETTTPSHSAQTTNGLRELP